MGFIVARACVLPCLILCSTLHSHSNLSTRAVTMKKDLRDSAKKIFLTTALAGFTLLSATVTHAGFQWVPPAGEKAPAASGNMNAAPGQSAAPAPVDEMVLPLPEDVSDAPVPVPTTENAAAISSEPYPVPAPVAPPQTLQPPAGYQPLPVPVQPAQPQQPVMKVRNISPSVPPASEALLEQPSATAPKKLPSVPAVATPQAKEEAWKEPTPIELPEPQPVVRNAPAKASHTALKLPPDTMALPVPDAPETKIVMPDDAPNSARGVAARDPGFTGGPINVVPGEGVAAKSKIDGQPVAKKTILPNDAPLKAVEKTPNSQKLAINPYPNKQGDLPPVETLNPVEPQAKSNSDKKLPTPASTTKQQPPQNFTTVEGFGSDMPLALALRQVVPAEYAYSFSKTVNPGANVSWNGGKPWNDVLSDMVAPLNLEAVVAGKIVRIQGKGEKHSSLDPNSAVKRANIKDPGEAPQIQTADALAGIETAAGTEGVIDVQPVPAKPAITEKKAETKKTVTATDSKTESWDAKSGESLKKTLARWSKKAGVELIWMASYDYKIKDDVHVDGTFENAVKDVFANSLDQKAAPTLNLQPGSKNAAPATLIIKDKAA